MNETTIATATARNALSERVWDELSEPRYGLTIEDRQSLLTDADDDTLARYAQDPQSAIRDLEDIKAAASVVADCHAWLAEQKAADISEQISEARAAAEKAIQALDLRVNDPGKFVSSDVLQTVNPAEELAQLRTIATDPREWLATLVAYYRYERDDEASADEIVSILC